MDSRDPGYWLDRWKKNEIRFHQAEYEPLLLQHFPKIAPGTVFVPLCGKSRDMIWLASQGHPVIGVELSAIACEAFFRENCPSDALNVEPRGAFTVYSAGKLTIYCGDFFALTAEQLADVTWVYDRAATIALPEALRRSYAKHLQAIVPHAEILLITLEYPEGMMPGPPHSVGIAEIQSHFGRERVRLLDQVNESAGFDGKPVYQNVFRISSR